MVGPPLTVSPLRAQPRPLVLKFGCAAKTLRSTTFTVRCWVALGEMALVAVTSSGQAPPEPSGGVPLNVAGGLKLTPGGNVPATAKVEASAPAAVKIGRAHV